MERPFRAGSGSVEKPQSTFGLRKLVAHPAGMCSSGFPLPGPASIRSTRVSGSADNRLARTQPAEPAPTMA